MLIHSILGLLLLAAPEQPIKLASPSLAYVNVDSATGELFLDYFAKQIELHGVRVTTGREIAALMGMERQRQLLNCSDGSSCIAELAGALGVDGVITGSLAKVGSSYVINIKIVDNQAQSLAVYSDRVKGEDAMLDWLTDTALKVAAQLERTLRHRELQPQLSAVPKATAGSPPAAGVSAPAFTWREKAWIPAVAGGVLAAGGVGMNMLARHTRDQITSASDTITSHAEAVTRAGQGQAQAVTSYALMSAGVIGLGVSGALALFGGPAEGAKVAVAPLHQGAAFTVGGSF